MAPRLITNCMYFFPWAKICVVRHLETYLHVLVQTPASKSLKKKKKKKKRRMSGSVRKSASGTGEPLPPHADVANRRQHIRRCYVLCAHHAPSLPVLFICKKGSPMAGRGAGSCRCQNSCIESSDRGRKILSMMPGVERRFMYWNDSEVMTVWKELGRYPVEFVRACLQ